MFGPYGKFTPYDETVDDLLQKLGISCDTRSAFAAQNVNLEALLELDPGDYKELGVKVGDRPMLRQAAVQEFQKLQGNTFPLHLSFLL